MEAIPNGFTYLGFPIFGGKREIDWFHPILHQLRKRYISLAERSTLTQSISNVMANYVMNCYKLHLKTGKVINLNQARFW